MPKKNLFIDIETSGLSPVEGHVPLAFGALIDGGAADSPVESLVVLIKPTDEQWQKANPDALKINGLTREQLDAEGLELPAAVTTICTWMAKHDVCADTAQYIGQNPHFDVNFMRFYLPELEVLDFPFDSPTNTIDMAKELVRRDRNFRVVSYKGKDTAIALGVEPEPDVHTALGGIEAVRRNYYALDKRLYSARLNPIRAL